MLEKRGVLSSSSPKVRSLFWALILNGFRITNFHFFADAQLQVSFETSCFFTIDTDREQTVAVVVRLPVLERVKFDVFWADEILLARWKTQVLEIFPLHIYAYNIVKFCRSFFYGKLDTLSDMNVDCNLLLQVDAKASIIDIHKEDQLTPMNLKKLVGFGFKFR